MWTQVDPQASKYPGGSPYNYSLNNPVKFVDLEGRKRHTCRLTHTGKRIRFEKSISEYLIINN